MTPHRTVRWRHPTDCEFLYHRGRTAITAEGTTLSMQDRTVATSDGLRSPQRAPLYIRRTVRWRHRTDCEFLHHIGHHSIYAGPYGGDIGRTASSFTTEDGLRSPQRAPLYLCRTVRWRHQTDCDHHRGHHSIYAGPYGGLFTAIR